MEWIACSNAELEAEFYGDSTQRQTQVKLAASEN